MLAKKREHVRKVYGISGKPQEAGFVNAPSFTDTSPRPGPQISDEVRNMFNIMQLNMMEREERIMRAMKKKEAR